MSIYILNECFVSPEKLLFRFYTAFALRGRYVHQRSSTTKLVLNDPTL